MRTNRLILFCINFACISILLHSIALSAQQEVIKRVAKLYTVNSNTTLSIDNKYGNIDVRDWANNEIKIDVEIVVKDLGKQRVDELIKYVTLHFDDSGEAINVRTEYDEAFFKLIGNNYHSEDKQFEVNYIVFMPSTLPSNFTNKYGNVFINTLNSKSTIDIKYGNLKANKLLSANRESMSEITLAYSNGTVEYCEWLKLNLSYSKLIVQKSKAIIVISKYSKIHVEQGSSIVCDSKYDTYEMGTLANFVTEAQYSNFRFDNISRKINLNAKYTDFKVKSVPASFESIDILNSYGSIAIGIAPEASYRILGMAKYAKINIPEGGRVNRFDESNEQRLEGVVGKEADKLPKVKIDTKYGGVNLMP